MTSTVSDDPRAEYTGRLEARRASVARHERRHRTMGNLRLLVAVVAAVIAWMAFAEGALSGWWLLVPAAVFATLAVIHDHVLRDRRAAGRAVVYYEKALARLDNRWMGTGEAGDRFADPAHPYSADLDLFGKGSLFEFLSIARTHMGEDILANWLAGPASPDAVRERQAAVEELRPRLDLREDLAVLGEEVRSDVHPEALAAWGEAPARFTSHWQRVGAAALTAAGLATAVIWAVTGERIPFLLTVMLEGGFLFHTRKAVARAAQEVEAAAHDLALLALVFERLERERFDTPLLARLGKEMEVQGQPPSLRLARLARLMEMLDSRHNLFVRMLEPVVLWTVHLTFAIEAWRRQTGPKLRRWLVAVGEMEALGSLAGYAWEHPADPFPELDPGSPCFDGEGLAHPLLAEERAVPNDVRLGGQPCVLVVSGSNMSGKSTLLRTVGVNAVLALAGAPVRARRLRLSPLQVGASIRVVDSLQGGSSRFYAEILRLRRIVDLTREGPPVLFLLDEFLHGTNSHDRRIGAEAIVRGLVERGAMGLVTTHDLALAHIADALGPRGANVHFEDRLEDGKLYFDYRLRPGVVTHSNALELMRSVGLEV
jgi:hypothetical protein